MRTASGTRLEPVSLAPALQRVVPRPEVRDHPVTRGILERVKSFDLSVEPEWEPSGSDRVNSFFREEKRTLVLRRNRGSFIKPWESDENLVGEDEWCLTPVEGCPLDCDYCYLQDYLDRPLIQWFVNQDRMVEQIECFLADPPEEPPHWFSLGELSDGLFLEPLTHTVRRIWDVFRESPARLEIRSKSHHVHGLSEALEPHSGGLFTWTLSPEGVDRKNEMLTAPLPQRLAAMKQMKSAGFRVAVRLDPVVLRDGWEEEYRELIRSMDRLLDLSELAFVMVGTFRFPRGFDRTIRQRFPDRSFHRDEFVEGPDGKLRYPRPRRVRAYSMLCEWIAQTGGEPRLCMEPPYVWEDTGLGLEPGISPSAF